MKRTVMKRIDKLRNIGVLAHVDAGKTTLTERMLFAAGRIHRMGEVHDGASAMDHRDVERRHGVTVSAAATSVSWRDHRVTILDTPGHVDFTQEVERALLAIDAAVVLFSGVSGVEPQTETVWAQAERRRLPRLGFVNKMDAAGADFETVLDGVRTRLGARPAAVQWPVVDPEGRVRLIDLVEERLLGWADADAKTEADALTPLAEPIPEPLRAGTAARRAALIETVVEAVAETDDAAVADFIEGRRFEADRLRGLIRRACVDGAALPVLAGAAYRGVGVTPLLDAVVDWAPSPADRGGARGLNPATGADEQRAPDEAAPVSALVSKVAVTRFGPMATVRVFSGRLARDSRVLNVATGASERIARVLALHADETVEVESAGPGDIVAVAGLKAAGAGDSLSDPKAPIAFAGLRPSEPVVEAAIEPATAADQAKLAPALAAMAREDPSLRVSSDKESGQLLLGGMGELHLQIALEALEGERGVAARIGPPRIAFREAVTRAATVSHTLRKQSGGPGQYAKLTLRIEPPAPGVDGLSFENASVGGAVPAEFVPAIETALRAALSEGPLAGYPIAGLRAVLLDGAHHPNDSSSLAFANAARLAFGEAYAQASPTILEPLARIEISAPEAHVGAVIADLQARRGAVSGVEPGPRAHHIAAEAPMANLWGYVGALRSLTRGRGQATVSFARYAPAPAALVASLRDAIA